MTAERDVASPEFVRFTREIAQRVHRHHSLGNVAHRPSPTRGVLSRRWLSRVVRRILARVRRVKT